MMLSEFVGTMERLHGLFKSAWGHIARRPTTINRDLMDAVLTLELYELELSLDTKTSVEGDVVSPDWVAGGGGVTKVRQKWSSHQSSRPKRHPLGCRFLAIRRVLINW
jgi:hypothetical protein